MKNDTYTQQLGKVWNHAVDNYSDGKRNPEDYFDREEREFLDSIGVSAQEVYDFAEDFVTAGEPSFASFASIHEVRRAYFTGVQASQLNEEKAEMSSYPPAQNTHRGIDYLPRIAAKAKSKLEGTLNPDIMYTCGNDRRFLKSHDIPSEEFLKKVWDTDADLDQLSDWIHEREDAKEGVACAC
jgi:hypothetical protein